MFTNLENTERERQRKRESRRQASEAQREKKQQRARARDKKTKFSSGGEKMRNAIGHQGEIERQWKKSEQEQIRYYLHNTYN